MRSNSVTFFLCFQLQESAVLPDDALKTIIFAFAKIFLTGWSSMETENRQSEFCSQ